MRAHFSIEVPEVRENLKTYIQRRGVSRSVERVSVCAFKRSVYLVREFCDKILFQSCYIITVLTKRSIVMSDNY